MTFCLTFLVICYCSLFLLLLLFKLENLLVFTVFQRNIDVCPECGNLKQKHVLCGYCYAKVKAETRLIRLEIRKKEGGPFNTPTVETVVLYDGEKPTENDKGKRIIERARKRPSWFVQNWCYRTNAHKTSYHSKKDHVFQECFACFVHSPLIWKTCELLGIL